MKSAGVIAGAAWRHALDLAYPRCCIGCGRMPEGGFEYLCWECMAGVIYLSAPMCARCGEPVEGNVGHAFTCHLCSGADRGFDLARSVVRHDGVLRDAVHSFKYRKGLWLRRDLCRLLATAWTAHYDEEDIDLVTCVPLHPARRRRRGYNQAGLLAAGLARHLRRPSIAGALRRIRDTRTQTNLTVEARATNVKGAFMARKTKQLIGRRVLLVDDVMTTGATVSECARCLKQAGAVRVLVVTLARG